MPSQVRVNLKPLDEWKAAVARRSSGVKRALRQWAVIYRSFVQQRYASLSTGASSYIEPWPPLAPSTVRQRRKGVGNSRFASIASMLRDTNTLFGVMTPIGGRPGSKEELSDFGITVGFGGVAQHPKSAMTIARLAEIHHDGAPSRNLPSRKIIVDPSLPTTEIMANVMEKAVAKEYV